MAPFAIFYRILAALIFYYVSRSIYRLYFHPLRDYPGPKLWIITRFSWTYYKLIGQLPFVVKRLHDQYGGVVRIGPNTLSYNSAEAWEKIYGFPPSGAKSFDKDLSERGAVAARVVAANILGANDEDHRRMRRLQSHAFSEKALSAQETVIQGYVTQFIRGLGKEAEASKTGLASLGSWFNFATFDIIGDLAFAESFDCLEKGVMNPWIQTIFKSLRPVNVMIEARMYPLTKPLLEYILPKFLGRSAANHRKYSAEKADRRMQLQTDRPDFMSYILKHNETEKGMTLAEIREGAAVFILAGSETTASLLTGLTYQLLQNPTALAKLTAEIRSSFKRAEEMTVHRLAEMEYLQGCLEEGLRMFPPVPGTLPRLVPPGGDTICGKFVPENVSVGVNQWAANYSPSNFLNPYEFHASRWLGDERFASDNRKARQPFSAGPRNCIGKNLAYAEMRLLMANLLWHYDLELAEESKDWMERTQIFVLWLKPELKVKLTPRRTDSTE